MSSGGSMRSDRSQTRFSTPVPELDDHRTRTRVNSVPRVEINQSESPPPPGQEMGRRGSITGSNLLNINEALREAGSVSRDFENAIVEDDESVRSLGNRPQGSYSPGVARRQTGRRSRNQPGDQPAERSRESSPSTRSSSPPNSVDAFADPRRRGRANTLDSQRPSEFENVLYRTTSIATHRRPTFSNESLVPVNTDPQEPLEQDDDGDKKLIIDYEELEEFVALSKTRRLSDLPNLNRKHSTGSHTRVFHDLRPKVDRDDACDPEDPTLMHNVNTSETFRVEEDYSNEKLSIAQLKNENKPNRFSFFSSESPDAIFAAELGDLILEGEKFRDLFDLGPEGGVWWLDITNPTPDEVNALAKAFSVHPLTSEDIIMQESREKVELFDSYYFVCFRSYDMNKKSEEFLEPINIYMVVWREGVLSFSFSETPHVDNVRRRSGKLRNHLSLSSDWICYAMIDNIVDSFGPIIRDIEQESESIEDEVFISRAEDFNEFLPRIGELRKKVMSLMRLLGGKADVIKGFAKRCNTEYRVTPRGDIGLYLGDVQDHVVTMMSNLGHFEKMLSRSHANYLAQLNFTNLMQSNNTNATLSKITVIATVLVPLNLICGLFGMNVPVPGRESEGLGWFFGILGVIALFVITSLALAKRMRYI